MSIRQAMLAILEQGPMYGYQLRAEFEQRTGETWPLNIGQVYTTLTRLERDGLVEVVGHGGADESDQGDRPDQAASDRQHVSYRATEAGRSEVSEWFATPVPRSQPPRDELAIKLAVAATLPGVDVAEIIQAQRRASLGQLESLNRAEYAGANADGPEELAWSLVVDSMVCAAEAELRWLDHTEQRLARHPDHGMALGLSTERPKRGRPARVEASVA